MSKKEYMHFRVSTEEKAMIEKAAVAAGKKISEYARDILLAASDYEVTETSVQSGKKLDLKNANSLNRDMHLRISEEEMIFYIEQAKAAGCSVSEYIRKSANGNDIYIVPGIRDMTKQIAKLGVNINQLTVLAHQGRIKEVDLFACNDTLKQILKELIKLSKKKG